MLKVCHNKNNHLVYMDNGRGDVCVFELDSCRSICKRAAVFYFEDAVIFNMFLEMKMFLMLQKNHYKNKDI